LNPEATDGINLEGHRIFIRLDRKRRHHRAGDDDFSAAQSFAERRQHIRDVPHDIHPISGIGLRIAGARELTAAPEDSADEVVRCAAGARRCVAREHNVALINIAGENALGVLRRRGEIDHLYCR